MDPISYMMRHGILLVSLALSAAYLAMVIGIARSSRQYVALASLGGVAFSLGLGCIMLFSPPLFFQSVALTLAAACWQ
jgi:hypothetical protein